MPKPATKLTTTDAKRLIRNQYLDWTIATAKTRYRRIQDSVVIWFADGDITSNTRDNLLNWSVQCMWDSAK